LPWIRSRFSSRWDFYAWVFFCSWVLLSVPSWARLPYFMDAYYHFSVMRGFLDAGGWVGSAFWEAAPIGRPHLYPPLFHFLGCAFLGAGLPLLFVARLMEFLIYPSFLFIFWRGTRRLTSDRIAFFFLVLLSASVSLYVYVIDNGPFSLAMVFGFGAYLFHRQGRWKTAGLLLAAAFYTHTLMSALVGGAFILSGALEGREGCRRAAASLLLGLVFAAPLFAHQWAFRSFYVFHRAMEFYSAQLSVPLYLLVVFGVWKAVRTGPGGRYFVVLYAAMAVLAVTNRDRFLSGQGIVPLCFFAATAMDLGWQRFGAAGLRKGWLLWALLAFLFLAATPQVNISAQTAPAVRVEVSSALRDIGGVEGVASVRGRTLYHPRFVGELADVVRARTQPDDILFSNFPYAGGMVAVLAHRATSTVMLAEVRPWTAFDPVRAARWVIWFKDPEGRNSRQLDDIRQVYGLTPAAETDLAWILENPGVAAGRRVIQAAWKWPFIVLFVLGAVLLWVVEAVQARKNRG